MTRIDPQPPLTRKEPVLIIDDDREIRGILQERLQIEGLESAAAASGEEGLSLFLARLAQGRPFSTLILDIRMKGISGIELLKLIRLIDQNSTILMISGLGDLSKAVLCLRHGADDYLSKPIKIWDLKARLTTAQGRRNAITHRQGGETNKGLRWGTAFIPQVPHEISSALDSATSIPGDESPEEASNSGPGEGGQDALGLVHGPTDAKESMKSPGPPMDPEVLETGREEKGQKGRKGGSFQDAPKRGKGETRAKAARESGALESGPGKKAPLAPSDPASHSGEEARLRAASPLDVFFFLIERLENQEVGWAGHSKRLSQFLCKAAALLVQDLDLGPQDLDALRLAGLIHNLGLIRVHGTLGQGFALPPHASTSPKKIDPSLLEDLTLPARVLEGLLPFLEPRHRQAGEIAQGILEQAGRIRRQLQEYDAILDKKQEKGGEEAQEKRAELLGFFFELADLCFHAGEEGLDLSTPPHPTSIEAYADKIGFPLEKTWETLSRISDGSAQT
ncbi:MAG TPA: response regulator [Planctomycetes bacterium]|nr:response regulator [Planctomycetota bacterium]